MEQTDNQSRNNNNNNQIEFNNDINNIKNN